MPLLRWPPLSHQFGRCSQPPACEILWPHLADFGCLRLARTSERWLSQTWAGVTWAPSGTSLHPHFHMLLTCGAFTPEGEYLELPELDLDRLQAPWQEAVFALYLAEDKIEPEVVGNMRSWPHSGFSVDQSVFLPAGDRAGIGRLVQSMPRCPREPVAAGPGDRDRSGDLQGREGRLPGLSRAA